MNDPYTNHEGGIFMNKKGFEGFTALPSMVLDTSTNEVRPLSSYQGKEYEELMIKMHEGKTFAGYKGSLKRKDKKPM